MSKLSQLKQEAYQAGKKRDWELAASIYEQILELDKNNPTVINEMGDLCLKGDDPANAVKYFLSAASRYRKTGLLNNAVAIYKKILRYDTENQNAHWYLAETRAQQGLLVEGERHGLSFLGNSGHVTGEIKEIFLKRCLQLFELFTASRSIQEKLLYVFRAYEMPLEVGRTRCLLACLDWDAGQEDVARQELADILGQMPEIRSYAEFQRLNKKINPGQETAPTPAVDFNSISLGESETGTEPAAVPIGPPADDLLAEPAAPPAPTAPADPGPLDGPGGGDEVSFAGLASKKDNAAETSFAGLAPEKEVAPAAVEEDCIELGEEDLGSSLADVMAAAASQIAASEPAADSAEQEPPLADPSTAPATEAGESDGESGGTPARGGEVDLLAEILADGEGVLDGNDSSQLNAITQEIGSQVGGEEGSQDSASLYEMGMVYLDMGLFDQAVESFKKAAADEEFAVRASEMCGITLLKADRPADAVDFLAGSLDLAAAGSKEFLGLQYHLGQAYEQAGRGEDAVETYRRIHEADPFYLDVGKRLSRLTTV